jgi:hypothetical protein
MGLFKLLQFVITSKDYALAVLNTSRHEDIVGSGGIAPPFLTSSLDENEWSVCRSGRFNSEEIAIGTH